MKRVLLCSAILALAAFAGSTSAGASELDGVTAPAIPAIDVLPALDAAPALGALETVLLSDALFAVAEGVPQS